MHLNGNKFSPLNEKSLAYQRPLAWPINDLAWPISDLKLAYQRPLAWPINDQVAWPIGDLPQNIFLQSQELKVILTTSNSRARS
jgi:hypothetical protein